MDAIKYCDRIILKTNRNLKKYGANSKYIKETLNYILYREKVMKNYKFLNDINFPSDLKKLSENDLQKFLMKLERK